MNAQTLDAILRARSERWWTDRAGFKVLTGARLAGLLLLVLTVGFLVPLDSAAADSTGTNTNASDDIPPLHPLRPEITLTFWERYGARIIGGSVLLLAGAGAVVWRLTRPKPTEILPPEVRARQELEPLRRLPENGAVLTRVSQVLRRYCAEVFELPPVELTTTEFCQSITSVEMIGPELGTALSDFLHRCDQRKFAPEPPPPLDAVEQALKLIARAQERREQFLAAQAAVPQGP